MRASQPSSAGRPWQLPPAHCLHPRIRDGQVSCRLTSRPPASWPKRGCASTAAASRFLQLASRSALATACSRSQAAVRSYDSGNRICMDEFGASVLFKFAGRACWHGTRIGTPCNKCAHVRPARRLAEQHGSGCSTHRKPNPPGSSGPPTARRLPTGPGRGPWVHTSEGPPGRPPGPRSWAGCRGCSAGGRREEAR